jgi:hypothetical protein
MEQFVIRTTGGPEPGLYFSDDSVTTWPLPEMLVAPGGHYQKVRESALPPLEGASAAHLVRGAEYEWVPDVVGLQADQSILPGTIIVNSASDDDDDVDGDDWVVGQET